MVAETSNGCHQSEKFIRSDDGSGEILFSWTNYQRTFRSGWKIQKKYVVYCFLLSAICFQQNFVSIETGFSPFMKNENSFGFSQNL